jgi:hypothetical protein
MSSVTNNIEAIESQRRKAYKRSIIGARVVLFFMFSLSLWGGINDYFQFYNNIWLDIGLGASSILIKCIAAKYYSDNLTKYNGRSEYLRHVKTRIQTIDKCLSMLRNSEVDLCQTTKNEVDKLEKTRDLHISKITFENSSIDLVY